MSSSNYCRLFRTFSNRTFSNFFEPHCTLLVLYSSEYFARVRCGSTLPNFFSTAPTCISIDLCACCSGHNFYLAWLPVRAISLFRQHKHHCMHGRPILGFISKHLTHMVPCTQALLHIIYLQGSRLSNHGFIVNRFA